MFQKITIEADTLEWLYVPDVEYANYDGLSRTLQMIIPWRPQWETDTRYPLVVFLPGSAFYRQEMYNSVPEFARIAQRGFVVAALQYRESNIAKFPAQIQDVHNAITFLKERSAEFHIDPDNIFVMGHSSGGYNALMAGVTAGIREFDGGANHTIRGMIGMAPPAYLSYEVEILDRGLTEYDPTDYLPELDMLGISRFEEDMALFHRARIESYVNRDIPPALLIHGDRDEAVTVENSRKLYGALADAKKEVTYYEITGQNHGGAWLWEERTLDLVERFIRSVTEQRGDLE